MTYLYIISISPCSTPLVVDRQIRIIIGGRRGRMEISIYTFLCNQWIPPI